MPRANVSAGLIATQNQGGGLSGLPSTIGINRFSSKVFKRNFCCSIACPANERIIKPNTHFETQTQLNTLRGVTKIIGDLSIQNFTSQPDFSVFSCLKEITGFFQFYNNIGLTTIYGFPNLENIGGKDVADIFLIRLNNELTTISGFPKLKNIIGSFEILDNDKLTTISGFSNLVNVNRFLTIDGNTSLTTISGFHEIVSVGGEFKISVNGTTITPNIHVIIHPTTFAKITTPGELVTLAGIDATRQLRLQTTLISALGWVGTADGASPAFVLGL